MGKTKETWLILAHCFNMDGRAASQTITDKLPFLMEQGVRPVVVSAPTGTKDTRFVHHRIFSPAPSGLNFELRKCIERDLGKGPASQILKAMVTLCCFPFLILEKIVVSLDSHWSWFMTAGVAGLVLINKHSPRVIYSTAGPSSTHLAGYFLKKGPACPGSLRSMTLWSPSRAKSGISAPPFINGWRKKYSSMPMP